MQPGSGWSVGVFLLAACGTGGCHQPLASPLTLPRAQDPMSAPQGSPHPAQSWGPHISPTGGWLTTMLPSDHHGTFSPCFLHHHYHVGFCTKLSQIRRGLFCSPLELFYCKIKQGDKWYCLSCRMKDARVIRQGDLNRIPWFHLFHTASVG